MVKRDLFSELKEGVESMGLHHEGKITLKTSELIYIEPVELNPNDITKIRNQFNMSRAVFANILRIPTRTLENWEQGRTRLPSSVAALLKLVEKYPDTLVKLQSI